MAAIVSTDFRVLNANNFKEDVADASNHVYIGIGKADVWSTTLSDRTDSTDISGEFPPNDHLDEFGIARQNLIAIKKVNSSDISHVVRRYNWTTNRAYTAWDSNDASIFDKEFYILTSEFKVYKCIVKGSGNSTIQPTQTLTSPTAESDGYVWKYMYTISVILLYLIKTIDSRSAMFQTLFILKFSSILNWRNLLNLVHTAQI